MFFIPLQAAQSTVRLHRYVSRAGSGRARRAVLTPRPRGERQIIFVPRFFLLAAAGKGFIAPSRRVP